MKTIKGQQNFLEYQQIKRPVDIVGLMDDAKCPNCKNYLPDNPYLDICPYCGVGIDMMRWIEINEEWIKWDKWKK